jgi:2-keto-4-pentenoate hydratase/2-oxohepta-3-ene-1,7-dioic acid hydratase in catechol pathway
VKIARCSDGSDIFWARIDLEAGRATRLMASFSEWAPSLARDPGTNQEMGRSASLEGIRFLAPFEPSSTVIAAGATYPKHVSGLGLKMPDAPSAFLKTQSTVIGPGDTIRYPAITDRLDYEGELVVVMGYSVGSEPMDAVLGYTIGNDVTARDQQFSGGVTGMDMFSAKAIDGTSPLGPWIVSRDEFGDGHPDLALEVTVDGEMRQQDRTGSMMWSVGELVSYIDARTRLHAGDVLFTGTCSGVGHEDGRYLREGQIVEIRIEGIGSLRNQVGIREQVGTTEKVDDAYL